MIKRVVLALLVVVIVGFVAARPAAAAAIEPRTETPAQECQKQTFAVPFWDVNCVIAGFQKTVGAVVGSAEKALADWITSSSAEAVTVLLTGFAGNGTDPTFTGGFHNVYYGTLGTSDTSKSGGHIGAMDLAIWLAIPILLGAVVYHLLAGDVGGLLRTVFVRLPFAAVVSFAAIAWVTVLLSLADGLTQAIVANGGLQPFADWANGLTPDNLGQDFLIVVVCLVMIFATLLAYIELVIRAGMIYIMVAFVPIVAIATLWPGARSALKRLAETTFVLIVSKLIIGFVLVLGATIMADPNGPTFFRTIEGAIILLLAGAAPLTVFRLVPLLEGAAIGAAAGIGAGWGVSKLRGGNQHLRGWTQQRGAAKQQDARRAEERTERARLALLGGGAGGATAAGANQLRFAGRSEEQTPGSSGQTPKAAATESPRVPVAATAAGTRNDSTGSDANG